MDIEILDWTSDLDRPSAIDALDTADLPVCHTVSVTERRIAIDDRTLIQNNVRTDTLALDLDGEWDGANVVVLIGKTGSEVELEWRGEPVVIPAQVAESVGAIDVSVVGYSSDGTVRLVTAEAAGAMTVIRSGALTGEVPADDVPDVLAQLLESATQARQAASTATSAAQKATASAASADAATEAAQSATAAATQATQAAQTAATAAAEAANTANSIIAQLPLPDGNVPRATRRGEVVSVDDAFAAVPLGLKVYGRTRQNLWVNPVAEEKNGMTIADVDGAMQMSGTPTKGNFDFGGSYDGERAKRYILKPSTTYFVSLDKNLPANVNIQVVRYSGDGTRLGTASIATSAGASFTTESNIGFCTMLVYFTSSISTADAISGTYRVMLNEGSTAEPWCPPGLTSAEPTQVVVAGKNLVPKLQSNTSRGLTFSVNEDGSVRVSGTTTGQYAASYVAGLNLKPGTYCIKKSGVSNIPCQVSLIRDGATKYFDASTNDAEVTVKDGDEKIQFRIVSNYLAGNTVDAILYPQLELGSTATDYEPPNVTTLTLDPVELRGLPDGTADVLDVGSGSVEAIAPLYEFDGDEGWRVHANGRFYCDITHGALTFKSGDSGGTNMFSSFSPVGANATYNGAAGLYVSKFYDSQTLDDFTSYLKANPGKVILELATPTTSTVTPVALPTLPSPVCNVWAVSDVPCEVEMEYIRDVNVVLAKLEGAM